METIKDLTMIEDNYYKEFNEDIQSCESEDDVHDFVESIMKDFELNLESQNLYFGKATSDYLNAIIGYLVFECQKYERDIIHFNSMLTYSEQASSYISTSSYLTTVDLLFYSVKKICEEEGNEYPFYLKSYLSFSQNRAKEKQIVIAEIKAKLWKNLMEENKKGEISWS